MVNKYNIIIPLVIGWLGLPLIYFLTKDTLTSVGHNPNLFILYPLLGIMTFITILSALRLRNKRGNTTPTK